MISQKDNAAERVKCLHGKTSLGWTGNPPAEPSQGPKLLNDRQPVSHVNVSLWF